MFTTSYPDPKFDNSVFYDGTRSKAWTKRNSNKNSPIAITGTGKEESEVIKFAIDWAPS